MGVSQRIRMIGDVSQNIKYMISSDLWVPISDRIGGRRVEEHCHHKNQQTAL